MIGGGQLRDRVTFERATLVPDGGGGYESGWAAIAGLEAVRGYFAPQRGREAVEAGRLESAVAGTLKVRSSAAARGVSAADRVIINGETFAIFAIMNEDRHDRYLTMTVERGSAQTS